MRRDHYEKAGFSTKAVHGGDKRDEATGAVIPPIFQTSTFSFAELGKPGPYVYSRGGNPTRHALERKMAVLEGGKYAYAYGSGLAAISALMHLLKPGDHVVSSTPVYGGSFRLFDQILREYGLDFTFVDTAQFDKTVEAFQKNTKLLFVETPNNPLLGISDLCRLSGMTRRENIILVADNTFASPYNLQPLRLGADAVVHSTTKYINGHCDVVGGIAVTNNADIGERLELIQKGIGAIPSPMDAWLIMRGVKTLGLRMERHNCNGIAAAEFLESHPKVEKVYYPGLETHPQHKLAREQMKGFGGILSCELRDYASVKKFVDKLELFEIAVSLGGVESLVNHPYSMTHAMVSEEARLEAGVTDRLIRFSVGIEDTEDLLDDLEQALEEV